MDSFVSHVLFLSLTILIVLVTSSSSVDVESRRRDVEPADEVRRHRPRLRQTPEGAIRRQIERVKQKILSQLSYGVRTGPMSRGLRRTSLPQPVLHLYDIDVTRQRGTASAADVAVDAASSSHVTRPDSQQHKLATLIVFGHRSKYTVGYTLQTLWAPYCRTLTTFAQKLTDSHAA